METGKFLPQISNTLKSDNLLIDTGEQIYLQKLEMKYILYRTIKKDLFQNEVGKNRQPAGEQYNISICQHYEPGKKY